MPTTVFVADNAINLLGVTDSGGTLSWTGANNGVANGSFGEMVDQNDDGDFDIGVDTQGSGAQVWTYTGYVVNLGGLQYGVFSGDPFATGNTQYTVPYDSNLADLSTTFASSGSTSVFNDNANLANCFLTGTMIDTPEGPRAIETLAIGDTVTTANGAAVEVKWVGRQTLNNVVNHWASDKLMPILIEKGALGAAVPSQDLYVTADHGLVVDGHLINAGALVNGSTIRVVAPSEMPATFTFWHVETEAHEVIVANGTEAESFIDVVGRSVFDNADEYIAHHGVERIIPEMATPRITAQRLLPQSIKARLGIDEQEAEAARA